MRKKLRTTVNVIYFRIGVNIIGLPIDFKHTIERNQNNSFLGATENVKVIQSLIMP